MSAMKDIATELELHWAPFLYCGYQRELPNGQSAVINTWSCGSDHGYSLTVNYQEQKFSYLHEAVLAAGEIARQQLADMAAEWAAMPVYN